MNRPAVLAFNMAGAAIARRAADAVGGDALGLASRVEGLDGSFEDAEAQVRELFRAGRPIIGVCASGILIRLLAPLLKDKRSEPPVLAVSDDGETVVPLLGGLTGADPLARKLAAALGGAAALTGAGARRFGVIFEAPPPGYALANPDDAKAVTSTLLGGKEARIEGSAPWIENSNLPVSGDGDIVLRFSPEVGAPPEGGLLFHPKVLVAEFDRPDAETLDRLDTAIASLGLAPAALSFATAPEGAPIHHVFVERLDARGVPLRLIEQRIEGGEIVHGEPGFRLHRFAEPQPPHASGRASGRVTVVGLGPGWKGWLAPEAAAALDRAQDLVGYEGYLAMVPERAGQRRHGSDNRVELERAQAAMTLAAQGREVAVVSSGDSGVFGMAAAVMEAAAAEPARWPGVAIEVAPGISAMQAAASRLGAPLGHDFAVISLSDQLKPWETIAARLDAAASADFALALYNPASLRRRKQLDDALEIVRRYRTRETPVALARDIGRPAEGMTLTTLGDLDPAVVDMRTLLVVGSSKTRVFARADGRLWMYTPRVYESGFGDPDEM
ncbi:precorrin-3B C(17)-methyltransferase [Chenggangzhangella methanolivorans]|uniref:Precorrin-3B C(17)-methyltransferase n=1 Tax=Chenggangzhangella methanolivorans TaxID=1437009 RepID=A0A9E6R9Y0_9HYPH|nr:precorrin-3B C(17)-methyltransferase [Chenggangzhangella methanolivorans]QZN99999.1 precorrin-3B C(17)-methyltransferase [Chenggangzhangella methanolivorans]